MNNLEFEVDDLITGLSTHTSGSDASLATNSKKQPYQKPLVVEIDLSGNSQGKVLLSAEGDGSVGVS